MAQQTQSECYTQRLAAADTGNDIIVIDPQIQTLRVVFRGYALRTGSKKRWMSQLSDGTLLPSRPFRWFGRRILIGSRRPNGCVNRSNLSWRR